MKLILAWNVSCACSILLPLVVLLINRIALNFGNDNGDGDGGEGEAAEWGWGDGPDNEGAASALFCYFWTLLLFLVLAVYGNYVLQPKRLASWFGMNGDETSNSRKLGTLTGATFVFSNMAFVLFIIVGGSMIEWDRPEDERFWSSSMFVPLTFLLWWISGVVFSILLFLRDENKNYEKEEEDNAKASQQSEEETGTNYACLT